MPADGLIQLRKRMRAWVWPEGAVSGGRFSYGSSVVGAGGLSRQVKASRMAV